MILTLLQNAEGSQMMTLLMFGGMFLIMYFFMIRPQQKKQKEEKNFQADLKQGDKVVTTSGIHGKIVSINQGTCVIETGAGRIKFERVAISKDLSKNANK